MKKKIVAFSVAGDAKNLRFYEQMKNSLRKFHSEEELPLKLYGPEEVASYNDPHFYYRATPVIGSELLKEYDVVIKLDADQIVMGDLSHLWEQDLDIGVVQNSNPREAKKYPVSVWNIDPLSYVNAGLVVMKNKELVNHWLQLCFTPHFGAYQMKEQDLLNIIVFYTAVGRYGVRFLDNSEKWHGLVTKGYEPMMELVDKKVFLPKNDEWPVNSKKQIVCYHFAGGNDDPSKGKYKIRFPEEISKHIDWLISDVK